MEWTGDGQRSATVTPSTIIPDERHEDNDMLLVENTDFLVIFEEQTKTITIYNRFIFPFFFCSASRTTNR